MTVGWHLQENVILMLKTIKTKLESKQTRRELTDDVIAQLASRLSSTLPCRATVASLQQQVYKLEGGM